MLPIETSGLITLVAGSSVLAALVSQGVAAFRDSRKANKDGSFAALYLAVALESYGSDCSSVISDSENYDSSGGHAGTAHGNVPDLPDYPPSIEWKPFGINQTTQAMSFRVEVESAKAMLRDYWDMVGDEDEVVPLMRQETARLGRKALGLAIEFRKEWKIPPVDYSADWNVKTHLNERVAKYEEQRKEREERNRKFNEEMFANIKTDGPIAEDS